MIYKNPYILNSDEYYIWEILIRNDFEAFCKMDWEMIHNDFIKEGFFGIDGKLSANKLDWCLTYDSLEAYKNDWINQSKEFNKKTFVSNPLDVLYATTKLSKIEIEANIALVHKVFNGVFEVANEEPIKLNWISLFILRKVEGNWKIANFTGYLPK
ncbi:hypothetical protein [Polaribacter sp. Hel_I_88]|uniref:hypothetical protein n=1 Tax=Polaribacter sp. Hel_I_88 TaxID=1250006 RepID=UPI0012DCBCCA|nr:hypothetical protein [Polaribacter sp. Hel_I_88]